MVGDFLKSPYRILRSNYLARCKFIDFEKVGLPLRNSLRIDSRWSNLHCKQQVGREVVLWSHHLDRSSWDLFHNPPTVLLQSSSRLFLFSCCTYYLISIIWKMIRVKISSEKYKSCILRKMRVPTTFGKLKTKS